MMPLLMSNWSELQSAIPGLTLSYVCTRRGQYKRESLNNIVQAKYDNVGGDAYHTTINNVASDINRLATMSLCLPKGLNCQS